MPYTHFINISESNKENDRRKARGIRGTVLCVFCSVLICFSFFILPVSNGFAGQEEKKAKIAILPFENFSNDKNAVTTVMPVLRENLRKKGFELLDEEGLNKFLLRERIRSTGYISKEVAWKMGEELHIGAILIGAVNSFLRGENPLVGLSARLVSTSEGAIVWANHTAATGEDFTTILGLGRIASIEKLTQKVIDRLLGSFSILPPSKEKEATYHIAIMPFQNNTKVKDIGIVATHMFITEVFKNKKFDPLEYGELRQHIVDFRVKDKGELNLKDTEAIADLSGVDGVIVGSVEVYNDGTDYVSQPEVSLSARLIDARRDKIVWSDSFECRGDEDIVLFDWGRIRSGENVAYKAVSRLVSEMSRAGWENNK